MSDEFRADPSMMPHRPGVITDHDETTSFDDVVKVLKAAEAEFRQADYVMKRRETELTVATENLDRADEELKKRAAQRLAAWERLTEMMGLPLPNKQGISGKLQTPRDLANLVDEHRFAEASMTEGEWSR